MLQTKMNQGRRLVDQLVEINGALKSLLIIKRGDGTSAEQLGKLESVVEESKHLIQEASASNARGISGTADEVGGS